MSSIESTCSHSFDVFVCLQAYKMSLRGIWERTVPVGGQFSGLVATIRDSPNT